jgi:imidazolonepropionase-like amidohydrolase
MQRTQWILPWNLINRGTMTGSHMFVSSYGLGTKPGWVAPDGGRINGPDDMMRATRDVIATGAGWVKLFASTGGTQDLSGFQIFTFEEMKPAVGIAHNLGKRVAVHSYGPGAGKDVVKARVDTLEHAVDLDDKTLNAMARQGTYYVPTIERNKRGTNFTRLLC